MMLKPKQRQRRQKQRPGLVARAFIGAGAPWDQAAGLNSFDAPALIGSAVSVAIFLLRSVSSLVWAVRVSTCFLAWDDHSSIACGSDLALTSSWAKSKAAAVLALTM